MGGGLYSLPFMILPFVLLVRTYPHVIDSIMREQEVYSTEGHS